jgi:trimeric autotransporter adhesin
MSYLDDYSDIQKNKDESRFDETAEYLVKHFSYVNDVARNQSETTMSKLSGVLTGILTREEYQQTLVKYDASENVVLYKKVDDGPNSIILDISDNHAIRIPTGTTAQRPTVLKDGYIRLNTTTNNLEMYINGSWGESLNTVTAQGVIENYVDGYIADISTNLNDKINRDISNVIGGASESLNTLLELENYVTDLSEGKIGTLITDFLDLSGREAQHFAQVTNDIITLSNEKVRDISDLSSITFHTISTEIVDLSSYTSSELSLEKSRLNNTISTEIQDLSNETMKDISDLSALTFNTLNTNITDLSNYTSSELSNKINDLSSETVRDISTLSTRETAHYDSVSTDIVDLSNTFNNDIIDLSSLTFSTLSIQISDLSSETARDISTVKSLTSSEISDLSSYTSSELSREIRDLSSATTRDISDLSSLTFFTLNTEIVDLSSETARDISMVKSLTSNEISDLSSYTSSELSREISDLSSSATRDISDLSSLTFSTLNTEIADLSSETARDISTVKSLTSSEISDLSSYTSSELSREIRDLSSLTTSDISDLSSLTFSTLSTEIADLSSETTRDISSVKSLTTSGITDLSSYTSSELSREIKDLSSESVRDIELAYDTLQYTSIWRIGSWGGTKYSFTGPGNLNVAQNPDIYLVRGEKYRFDNRSSGYPFRIQQTQGINGTIYNDGVTNNSGGDGVNIIIDVPFNAPSILYYQCTSEVSMNGKFIINDKKNEEEIQDLSSYTSSELSREISDLSSSATRDISDLSSLTFSTLSTEIADLSSETTRDISTVKSLTSSEISDLSSYTSSELSREITDLSSSATRDISDLSSLTFSTLSTEIADLSSETTRDISTVKSLTSSEISDLSSYTSSELSREIRDLSSATTRDISDLSSLTFSTLSTEIADLSSETTRDISTVKSLTSSEISDLSSYTSSELSREISDLSSSTVRDISDLSSLTFSTLSTEIADLSSETARDISATKSELISTINTQISALSSEIVSDIVDLSNLTFQTINTKITDLSSYTSSELNREISTERSIVVRDLSDMSGDLHYIIDELIGNAPATLDTLEEIAFTLGNPLEPSGGGIGTVLSKIYSVSQDIYDLSQTVAGVDADYRNLNGRLTIDITTEPTETLGLNVIGGDISLNKTLLMYNKDNIIVGNNLTGDTIKNITSYANIPQGNVLIGSNTDISNDAIQFATGLGYGIDLSGTGSTALGYLAKTDGINSTAIGYGSKAIGNNVIQLGNSQVEYVNTNGVVTMSSDARLKQNINTIPFALDKVSALRGVTYTRNDLPDKETVYMGLIAQETEKIVPEVVNNNSEYKSIMYNSLTGLLVEAIKDLNVKHNLLDGRQTSIEKEISSIKQIIREKLQQLNKIKNLVDVKDKH